MKPSLEDLQCLNMSRILELKSIDEEGDAFIKDLIHTFLSTAHNQLMLIADAPSNFINAQKLAHKLRSCSGNIGAEQFSYLSGQAEIAAQERNLSDLKSFIALLQNEFKQVNEALNAYLRQNDSQRST